MTDILIPTVEHIKQDVWIRQNSSEPPIAVLMFIFTSKGGFTGQPIHVKIQMWLTEGGITPTLPSFFQTAYAYPRNQTLVNPQVPLDLFKRRKTMKCYNFKTSLAHNIYT